MTQKGPRLALAALLAVAGGSVSAQGYSLLTGQGLHRPAAPAVEQAAPDEGAFEQAALDPSAAGQSAFGRGSEPLIRARAEIPDTAEAEEIRGRAQSLFIGQASHGFFAPFQPRDRGSSAGGAPFSGGSIADAYGPILGNDPQAEMIRHLIAQAEAGRDGYDAVQYGARIKPDRPPTQMTLGDVFAWIKDTPGQPHAIGRYQFIPSTLARLVTILDASPHERFSPQMQDRLADILLQEAGLDAYRAGRMTRHGFMNNLAKIWAGLPNSSGRSHYHGYAGNAATMSWARFDTEMARIFQG